MSHRSDSGPVRSVLWSPLRLLLALIAAVALFTTSCGETETINVQDVPRDVRVQLLANVTGGTGPPISAALLRVDAEATDVVAPTATKLMTYVENSDTYIALVFAEPVNFTEFGFTYLGNEPPAIDIVGVADQFNDLYGSSSLFRVVVEVVDE